MHFSNVIKYSATEISRCFANAPCATIFVVAFMVFVRVAGRYLGTDSMQYFRVMTIGYYVSTVLSVVFLAMCVKTDTLNNEVISMVMRRVTYICRNKSAREVL